MFFSTSVNPLFWFHKRLVPHSCTVKCICMYCRWLTATATLQQAHQCYLHQLWPTNCSVLQNTQFTFMDRIFKSQSSPKKLSEFSFILGFKLLRGLGVELAHPVCGVSGGVISCTSQLAYFDCQYKNQSHALTFDLVC